jgi:hypothetical protein
MIKPNRKTWIYGVQGTNAKIHYPPVVPWIKPATRDALIDLFLDVSDAELATTADEVANLESRIAQLEGRDSLTSVEQRQLLQYRKEVETLQQKLACSRERLLADARAEALNLSLIKGIRSVEVIKDMYGFKKLVVTTAPIKISKALLGTYDIFIDPRETTPSSAIDLIRRDRLQDHGPHPHWSNHPCFGTWGPMLHQMMQRKNWSAVVGAMLNYLARYYGKSPLIKLERFYPGGYYENATPTV